jgi:hypothetical protein
MNIRHAVFAFLGIASFVVPACVDAATTDSQPGTMNYATWAAQTPDQKTSIVAGDMDGIITGYFEPVLIVTLTSMLTGNKDVTTIKDNLNKTVPAFSKKPADYVSLIDTTYAKPATRKLSVGNVLMCLADQPYGAPHTTTDDCIKTFL